MMRPLRPNDKAPPTKGSPTRNVVDGDPVGKDESLCCRPTNTPTWKNRMNQSDKDWAELHWFWSSIGTILYNIAVMLSTWPLNAAILYGLIWPILKLIEYLEVDPVSAWSVVHL